MRKETTYYVKGMHCASCELNIERKLLEIKGVKSAEASLNKGRVTVECDGAVVDAGKLNSLFKKEGYKFFGAPVKEKNNFDFNDFAIIFGISVIAISLFVLLEQSGLSALINVNRYSSLPAFFVFGLLAGVSTCAALVGGIVLSMSKRWAELYAGENAFVKKSEPHILFNIGRVLSYGFFGSILGLIGGGLKLSASFASLLIIAVSVFMVFFALDMFGIGIFRKFQVTMPKFITRYVADEKHFKGKYMPFLMGAGTFFLPCGFTVTVQSLALLSGNMLQGGLIMGMFALGTAPMLLAIGLSSVGFLKNPEMSSRFMKIAGVLILFFAIFNINSQFNAMGLKSLNDIKINQQPLRQLADSDQQLPTGELPPIVDGKQIVKMKASVFGYDPDYIRVRAGIPIKWEIEDTGTSGCTNAVVSKGLFDGQISLTPGEISEKEFTIQKAGKYKFSCWMGMVSGVIEAF